jgi:hypothetical protein
MGILDALSGRQQVVTADEVASELQPFLVDGERVEAKESAGVLDLDAELKLWVRGIPDPLSFNFNKDAPINDVYRVLGAHILR